VERMTLGRVLWAFTALRCTNGAGLRFARADSTSSTRNQISRRQYTIVLHSLHFPDGARKRPCLPNETALDLDAAFLSRESSIRGTIASRLIGAREAGSAR
jgi:hypothetical protein